jgi:hypothetical protein
MAGWHICDEDEWEAEEDEFLPMQFIDGPAV